MGGHVIIRSQIRSAAEDPLNNAAIPDPLRTTVNAILANANSSWSHTDCYTLAFALALIACDNPNS